MSFVTSPSPSPSGSKRQHKANYGDNEIRVMLEEVMLARIVLFAAFNNKITLQEKNRAWDGVMVTVNACGVAKRSRVKIKEKWKAMKADVLGRQRRAAQTGGGPPESGVPYEESILQIIGYESNLIQGVNAPIRPASSIFFNYLMPDHDAGDVFNPPNMHRLGRLDWWMRILFDGFRRWDSIYFLHIAEHGYTYENTLAFCPLYPMLVRLLANSLFLPLHYFLNYPTVLLITAVLLNVYFFVKSAKALYLLSERVLGDETLALKTAQLYCINPASIFFSAAYSEASFAFLTFNGLLEYEKRNFSGASLFFGFSALARSNGIVNAGFILYRKFMDLIEAFLAPTTKECVDRKSSVIASIWSIMVTILVTMIYVLLCLAPFAAYQAYAYSIFCNNNASYKDLPNHILNYGNNRKYKMAHSGLSPWCHKMLPLSYAYVQAAHWNNGFLQYYQVKQIPNFLLAAPMVVLCACALVAWGRHNGRRLMAEGGLRGEEYYKKYDEERMERVAGDHGFYSIRVFVYVMHILGLLTTAVLFMHIQVLTRFIACASPVVYWFVATATTPADQLRPKSARREVPKTPATSALSAATNGQVPPTKSPLDLDIVDWDKTNIASKAVFTYFHLYFFVGVAAFSNFLPWT